MSILSAFILFMCIWWIIFFMMLPVGVRVPEKTNTGLATSAPEKPRLWWKFGMTTLITTAVWGAVCAVIILKLISFP